MENKKTNSNGDVIYLDENGRPHREDGPAIIYKNGEENWYLHGRRHRVGGPAFTYADGSEKWYVNDKLHRTDGPAITYIEPEFEELWYIDGVELTKDEFDKKTINENRFFTTITEFKQYLNKSK